MEQLRQRIEALERWTRKLRSERDTVEVHFRHHSKEQESMTLDLLERMRELQAVGSTTTEGESRPFSPRMDADTVERLRDLSAQLGKQTQDLQETLCRKTCQIRQLKWELLHRDLSTVKQETERHTHSAAQKKRSKYAHWRSRSSEESGSVAPPQKSEGFERTEAPPDAYCLSSSVEEFQADDLVHTVHQLSEEVRKLTSLSQCCEDENMYTNVTLAAKDLEQTSRIHKKVSIKPGSKRITVRRNSADNSSLLSTDDSRLRGESPTSHSDNSSDDCYTKVCYNAGGKANISNNSEAERLLMSYGENPPRTQRRKKLQKVSKLNSSLGRRRSNTFHTNRDLQKPVIAENAPQKCHSFRVPRENYNEDSTIIKTPYFRRKLQSSNFTLPTKTGNSSEIKISPEAILFRSEDDFRNGRKNLIREASSDSKIPLIMKVKKYSDPSGEEKSNRKLPVRSMSDKSRSEVAAENVNLQKKRSKKRLKPPDFSKADSTKEYVAEIFLNLDSNRPKSINSSQGVRSRNQKVHDFSKKKFEDSHSEVSNDNAEIPTITIQFPKRKHRKPLNIDDGAADEQSVTIIVPKKRSLSSECDSSISESSPREESKTQHSYKTNNTSDSSVQKNSLAPSNTDSVLSSSNDKNNTSSMGSIHLMKLVSLDNFENPFDQNKIPTTKDHKQNESQARKRKAQDGEATTKTSPSEEMIDMINAGQEQAFRDKSYGLTKSSTIGIEHSNSENISPSTSYIKSPSAPQLDWRKACAKKISKSGAPNVRTLIERYNQKVIDSQTGKSPSSSNVSSPTSLRKTSTPVNSSCAQQYVPHFSSTPNTPTTTPTYSSLGFISNFPKSPPPSPSSVARSEALKKAKEQFITSPQLSPLMQRTDKTSVSPWVDPERETFPLGRSDEDRMSHSSMDSMNLVMLRAGESCRESRMPKKSTDSQKSEPTDRHNLKTSKSLSSSSLFKAVLHSDFKVPPNLLKLKRSKRKKDMSTVTELCRQSLLLTSEDSPNILTPASHKSCPSSPELKSKTHKPNWLQRNIFRHK